MRISDWSSDVCSSDLIGVVVDALHQDAGEEEIGEHDEALVAEPRRMLEPGLDQRKGDAGVAGLAPAEAEALPQQAHDLGDVGIGVGVRGAATNHHQQGRSEEHTSELQSLMRISYAVFCLKKKNKRTHTQK